MENVVVVLCVVAFLSAVALPNRALFVVSHLGVIACSILIGILILTHASWETMGLIAALWLLCAINVRCGAMMETPAFSRYRASEREIVCAHHQRIGPPGNCTACGQLAELSADVEIQLGVKEEHTRSARLCQECFLLFRNQPLVLKHGGFPAGG